MDGITDFINALLLSPHQGKTQRSWPSVAQQRSLLDPNLAGTLILDFHSPEILPHLIKPVMDDVLFQPKPTNDVSSQLNHD